MPQSFGGPVFRVAKEGRGPEVRFDSSESTVYFLKNYGLCFSRHQRYDEADEQLKKACDVADKLADPRTRCKSEAY